MILLFKLAKIHFWTKPKSYRKRPLFQRKFLCYKVNEHLLAVYRCKTYNYVDIYHFFYQNFVANDVYGMIFEPCFLPPARNKGWAKIRPKRRFVPSDNSSQVTIRPKFQKATIRPILKRRQFVPFVKSDNSSQIV